MAPLVRIVTVLGTCRRLHMPYGNLREAREIGGLLHALWGLPPTGLICTFLSSLDLEMSE